MSDSAREPLAGGGTGELRLPRLFITGTHRGVGVSTIVLGLIVALRRRGTGVGAAKIGISLAEPTHFRRVMGRLSYTMDPWLLSPEQLRESLGRLMAGTELAIFEGSRGLYDSEGRDSAFANEAEVAEWLGTPVVLVVDARGLDESIGALVHGYATFRKARVAGVIANRIRDAEHNALLESAVQELPGVRYLGGVAVGDPHQTGGTLAGLQIHNPSALTRNRVIGTGALIEAGVRLDELLELGSQASVLPLPTTLPPQVPKMCRLAVADDQAFHLNAQDNLDLIRRSGGELVAFSPIADRRIPADATALYLPGGYIHLYAADLAANGAMLEAIRQFAQNGGRIYAEGASLAYLSRRVVLFNGASHEMVGLLPGVASAVIDDSQPSVYTYVELTAQSDTLICERGTVMRGMRDNRWSLRLESAVRSQCTVHERLENSNVRLEDGYAPLPNVFISRANIHWGSACSLSTRFVEQSATARA